jgi:polysaccharide deacetylase family protein (PEP-CTERM system associated)
VEDYFHGTAFGYLSMRDWDTLPGRVEVNTRDLLDLLAVHDHLVTFFVLGWVAEKYPGLVREIRDRGHEIASHGYRHRSVASSSKEFAEDITRAKQVLEDVTSVEVRGHRLPCFGVSRTMDWFLDVVRDCGYLYDSSLYPTYHSWYHWSPQRRGTHKTENGLWEVPMSAAPLLGVELPMAGGGYVRLLPAVAFLWGMARLRKKGMQICMYIHPYDIDRRSPSPGSASLARRIRRGLAFGNPAAKLTKILADWRFGKLIDTIPIGERQSR